MNRPYGDMGKNIPTRLDIENALEAHKGQGRAAMSAAVGNLKETFTDMTDDDVAKIKDDLLSYTAYFNETT